MTPGIFIIVILVMATIVFFLRAVPFLFSKKLQQSKLAQIFSRSLPLAIMLLLTLHGVSESSKHTSALVGVAFTALIHLLFKQPIISIAAGTAAYILLIHFVV